MPPGFTQQIRIYFEDTDAGGIVYHASWLRFFERCRTDWLRSLGVSQAEWARESGLGFVVRDLQIEYLRPGRLDDLIQIDLAVAELRKASIQLNHRAYLPGQDDPLVTARVRVAVVNHQTGRARALPAFLHDRIRTTFAPIDSEEFSGDAQ
ncbi:MAG: hypothetical protein RL322_3213 [Pseudomonadota bacterium]|jgi:acyl-CoA thioester hydrolase